MLQPARPNPGQRKVSRGASLPAPVKGWFVGDNIAAAPPQTAYVMDNVFPDANSVRVRRGTLEHASGMGSSGVIERLMVYDNSVAAKMFAAVGGSIYDVTTGGAVGAAVVSGMTNAKWSYTQITTAGGTFLRLVNGADTPRVYDGSTWGTAPAITGATPTDLKSVWAYRNRLYFAEKNSLSAWYLPVDSIGGAATELPLGAVFTLGGELLTGGSWSANLNARSDDMAVFISSAGEVAVYTGSYPGDTAWSLQGLYRIGKPLGSECLLKAGGDLAILTEDGLVPMSKVVSLDRVALANEALSLPIQPEWRRAVKDRAGLDGWSITLWPLEQMAIVNLAQLDSNTLVQYVANARTGAWCRYTGWDARSFAVLDNELYFGTSDGRVMQAETGGTDDGELYTATIMFSYTELKGGPNRKRVTAMRPLCRASFNVEPKFSILVDFNETLPSPPAAASDAGAGALWDAAVWDSATWPGVVSQQAYWKGIGGIGSVVAPVVQASISSTEEPDFELLQVDLLFELGEAVG